MLDSLDARERSYYNSANGINFTISKDAYTSRIVRGQSTLKDVIERLFWNELSRERLKAK